MRAREWAARCLTVCRAQWLAENELLRTIRIHFTAKAVAPTSISGDVMTVCVPMRYRDKQLDGVLNHEVGTHYMRHANHRQQPFAKAAARKAAGVKV